MNETRSARIVVVAAVLSVVFCATSGAAQESPSTAVNGFYAAYTKQPFTGLPTGDAWKRVAPHVSGSLARLMTAAQAEQARCKKGFPDEKPPWVEGDMFSSSFEGFTKFRVADGASPTGARATIAVEFEYAKGDKPVTWRDEILLVREGQRWVIDDVRYRRGQGFGNGFGEGLKKALAPGKAC
jgi:hypothetical protein